MKKHEEMDLSKVRLNSVAERPSKVDQELMATLGDGSIKGYFDSLPKLLKAQDLNELISHIQNAVRNKKPLIVGLGGHVIKCGLAPLLIELVKKGYITCLASNGSVIVHDYELAMFGKTSEDVAVRLADGSFGMALETNRDLCEVIKQAAREGIGLGQAVGKFLSENAPYAANSLLATAYKHEVPFTVHVAVGTDIIHQSGYTDGAAIGDCSHRDFRIFCHQVSLLDGGGVYLNLGSAVILPEVFLKALTVSRNIKGKVQDFYTAVFDMNFHYRANENVVMRPVLNGGKGYYFIGHHEIMIPLLIQGIESR
jgi:hypothetical protein